MRFGIIAAGEGSRLMQEGCNVSKPLVKIGGVPMIERLAKMFMNCGADRIAIIVNGCNNDTLQHVQYMSNFMPIDLVIKQTPTPMHSLMALRPYLEGSRFCVTTVDTVFSEQSLKSMMHEFATLSHNGLMGITSLIDDEKPLYVDVDERMDIRSFEDTQGSCKYVSAGVYALDDKAWGVLDSCLECGELRMRFFQRRLLKSGLSLHAFDMGQVVDVDHVSDIERAQQIYTK